MSARPDIEDIYPLSPAQQGILIHTLRDPGSGVYCVQLGCTLAGSLDIEQFEAAWRWIIERYPVLRTAFVWEGVETPVQVVTRKFEVPLRVEDWRHLPPAAREAALNDYLTQDRQTGFELGQAPLMRLALFRLSADRVRFVWSHSHLLLDGWSVSIVVQEAFDAYEAKVRGDELRARRPRPFRDFIAWHLQQDATLASSFWNRYLRGVVASTRLGLPLVAPPPSGRQQQEARYRVDATTTDRLRALVAQHGLTLNTLVQGAWAILLAHYGGREDLLFGAVTAGRPAELAGAEAMVGMFINTLPVRAVIDWDAPLADWLESLQAGQVEARQFESSSLMQIQRSLGLPTEHPLFDTLLAFENYPLGESLAEVDLSLEISEVRMWSGDHYGVTLVAAPGREIGLLLAAEELELEVMQRLVGQLGALMEAMAGGLDRRLEELPILTPSDRHQVIEGWNDTLRQSAWPRPFHRWVEAATERSPAATALVCGDDQLTYGELGEQSNQLARRLRQRGIAEEAPVVLLLDRSVGQIVALLAILKAGGTCVPLDPWQPVERLRTLLGSIGARRILSAGKPLARLAELAIAGVDDLQHELERAAGLGSGPLDLRVDMQQAAYAIFTSGSSGVPKGIVIPHAALFNLNQMLDQEVYSRTSKQLAVTVNAPLYFDASWQGVGRLAWGDQVHILKAEVRAEPAALVAYLEDHEIDVLDLTPTLLRQALAAGLGQGEGRPELVLVGGEPFNEDLWQLAARRSGSRFYNVYGPTECTINCTWQQVSEGDPPSVGRPVGNYRAYVLNSRAEPLSPRASGELYVAGAGLARGYLGRPGMTAERFAPDPFGAAGSRMYRTGDLARHTSAGRLEILGRLDQQVKVHGARVEIGEIEAVLRRFPALEETVVAIRQQAAAPLVAWIVPRPLPSTQRRELMDHLRSWLPEYMVPSLLVGVEEMPRLASGKIDHRALLRLAEEAQPEESSRGRWDWIEELLVEVWSEVLGVDSIGAESDFFAQGGNSLLATRAVSRLRQALRVEVPLRSIFDTPRLPDLATELRLLVTEARGVSLPPLTAARRPRQIPLSFAQQRLWFLQRLDPGSSTYNLPLALRLLGPLDVAALRQALRRLVDRHEALRTTFPDSGGRPRQQIDQSALLDMPLVELAGCPASEVERQVADFARRPFDLARGPLLRALLLRLAPSEHVAVLSMHHTVSDGRSIEIMISELSHFYRQALGQPVASLPALPVQYADYATWQRGWLAGDFLQRQLDFWKGQLDGAPERLELPVDRARLALRSVAGGRYHSHLGADSYAALRQLGRARSMTPFMVLAALFEALLSRLSGQSEVTLGTPVAGRGELATEGLVGMFVNTLVLRGELEVGSTFVDLLQQVRQVALEVYAHQEVPFEKLVDELQPERSLSRTPLFEAMLVFEQRAPAALELPGLRVEGFKAAPAVAKFDLTLLASEQDDGLALAFEYGSEIFDASTIERWMGYLQRLAQAVIEDPQAELASVALLSTAERQELLQEWSGTGARYELRGGLWEAFAATSASCPEALALSFEGHSLTYGQLHAAAGSLAGQLWSAGVRPGALVALLLPRDTTLVVSILAILRCAAAYLPVDPELPAARLRFIAADSGAEVWVTCAALRQQLPPAVGSVVELEVGESLPEPLERVPSWVTGEPELPAYVIYTSGSTGRPKGVVVSHGQVLRLLRATKADFRFTATEVWTLFHSYSFDFSVWEIWGALLYGGRLVVVPYWVSRSPERFLKLLATSRVTVLNQTPSAFRQLIQAEALRPTELALRWVIFGGEALDPSTLSAWVDRHGDDAPGLVNMYGITETTVHVTYHRLLRAEVRGGFGSAIGQPLADLRLYLLDRLGQPVPQGVGGELVVGGGGVARGYLGRAGLTAARFVPDPYGCDSGERLYRSGDLGRWLADGGVEYLGRLDQQVKVRGFRIELGEIEAVLSQHQAVAEVAVMARRDGAAESIRLVAYVVPTAAGLALEELRAHLAARLPAYMVPAAFVELPALPLTANGKLDRRALPAPEAQRPQLAGSLVAPRGPVEETLVRIWEEVLGVEGIGSQDNFFALGGDSILSIQIVAKANQAALRLLPKDVFLHQTVAELAAVVGQAPAIDAEAGEVTGEQWLTPIQRWFFASCATDRHHFNQSLLFEVRQRLDPARLLAVVGVLLGQHDALRLRFSESASGWQARYETADRPNVAFEADLSALPQVARSAALEKLAAAVQTSLDLAAGPLLRIGWIEMGSGEHGRLLLVVHHLVIDGVSWRILLEDLQSAYADLAAGRPLALPAKTTSYQRWAQRLWQHASSSRVADELRYWSVDRGWAGRRLPRRPAAASGNGRRRSTRSLGISLDEAETRALLNEVHGAYRTRVQDLLIAALAMAFRRWTGAPGLLLDLESHGREELADDIDVSRTVGWFTVIAPVALDLQGLEQPAEVLKEVKESLRTLPRQGLAYGLARYAAGSSAAAAAPLPDAEVSFNYLGQLDRVLGAESSFVPAAEQAGRDLSPQQERVYLLEVGARIADHRLQAHFDFSSECHRAATIEALAAGFREALRELIRHCLEPAAGGFTPSDFVLAGLDQQTLDRLADQVGDVEDIYPLAPLQQGLLFHSLEQPAAGVYVEQLTCKLVGELDRSAFNRAWRTAIGRHSILRTSFHWRDLDQPLQIVHRQAAPRLELLDWRQLDGAAQDESLARLRDEDSRRGFDLETPPLRLFLMRCGPREHRLLWTFHHLLLDGWSLPILLNEVFSSYAAEQAGQVEPALAARPYRDYIDWISRQDRDQAESYWRGHLADFSAPSRIEVEGGMEAGAAERAEWQVLLSAELTADLRAFAASNRLTLNTVLQGMWALLLARWSGTSDVLFGAVTSGRPVTLPGVERMVGLFINTIPVRVSVHGAATVAVLGELQSDQIEARQHEFLPLNVIQAFTGVAPPTRLFDSLLVFENYPEERTSGSADEQGLRVDDYRFSESTGYPLTLMAAPFDRLSLTLQADSATLAEVDLRRLAASLERLLASLPEHADRPLLELPTWSASELQQARVEWNDSAAQFAAADHCLAELLERAFSRWPERCAVISGTAELSYGELDQRSASLAFWLLERGVGAESRVGVCLQRGTDLVIALVAILRAGGAYVPLDPEYPAQRLAFMVDDSSPSLVLTSAALGERLAGVKPPLIYLDSLEQELARVCRQSQLAACRRGGADRLAYVIYTSGSTGRPKGAMNSHRAIVNRLLWMQAAYGLEADDRVLQKTPMSFDVSVWEFFWPLSVGAGLVLARPGGHRDPDYLVELIERRRVTTLHFVPSMLRAFLAAEGLPRCAPLRRLISSGEALPAELVRATRQRLGCPLHNLYGPTEAAVDVTAWPCGRAEESGRVPIGRPIGNLRLLVLSPDLRGLPGGVVGELHIAGVGLARGYWARPALTAESWLPAPSPSVPGERLYRTGDLARWRSDGALEYFGRLDQQVKIRGLRIELGEIEAALESHPAVVAAAVLALPLAGSDADRLAAWVVPQGDHPAVDALRDHLGQRLPSYMVPATVTVLEKLPLTANGKLDRRALSELQEIRPSAGPQRPMGPLEALVAQTFERLLGVEEVAAEDSFFALGGHSLLALQVASALRQVTATEVALQQVLRHPTVAELAASIEISRRSGGALPLPPLEPLERGDAIPLSFAQQQLWFLHQLRPESTAYNLATAFRLRGALDRRAFAAAISELVRRHEALRTAFEDRSGTPAQVLVDFAADLLTVVDLSSLAAGCRLAEARRGMRLEANRSYDLEHSALFRARLWRLADDHHVALLAIHHIVSDGWSMGVMARELGELYGAYCQARQSPLAEPEVQFADWALWQHRWMGEAAVGRQLDYWREQLAGIPPLLELPIDRPRPSVPSTAGDFAPVVFSAELTAAVDALARQHLVTPFMVQTAAFQALLGRYSGQDDFCIGTVVAGRHHAGTESLVGFFVNTLVLRAELAGEPCLAALLQRTKSSVLEAYRHQDLPFEKLVEELDPVRSLTYPPIFQALLVQQAGWQSDAELEGLEAEPMGVRGEAVQMDLVLSLEHREGHIAGTLQFRKDLFDRTTISRLNGHLQRLLAVAIERPEAALSSLPLLAASERQQLLQEYSDSATSYPDAVLGLWRLIARQAEQRPDAVALSAVGGSLSYAELLQRSRRLGARLLDLGVGPEVRVGICLQRSPEMVLALLGVLAAGGAWVPVDPELPTARQSFLIEDSGVELLLCDTAERPPAGDIRCLRVAELVGDDASLVERLPLPDQLAYVIYTSGSTGRPKGVMVSQRAILNRLLWMQATYPIGSGDRVLQKTSLGFDASVWEFFAPLLAGATLELAAAGEQRDLAALGRRVLRRRTTVLQLVPSQLQIYVEEPVSAEPAALRRLFSGGEALPERLRQRVGERLGVALINLYGPTETAIDASHQSADRRTSASSVVPIGRPVGNLRPRVVARRMRLVPPGAAGELWVGGLGLARGYAGRPTWTAERFVPDPWPSRPGARLYRTGDRVRWLADGRLEYRGRVDQQLKVRGVRIEPGEIESVLHRQSGLQAAAVAVAGHGPEGRLVAYCVALGAPPSAAELRQHLAAELPETMLPSVYVMLDELPRMASGKVDRGALLALPAAGLAAAVRRAPRTPTESLLVGVWQQILGLETVGPEDDFFDLGGHSLLATRVISQIREALGVEVALRQLFEAPVLADLARALDRGLRGADLPPPPLVRTTEPEPPLSFAQERLWFLQQLDPWLTAYNLLVAVRFSGPLDLAALAMALHWLVERHAVLRTVFVERDGEPRQVVRSAVPISLPQVDLEGLRPAQREAELQRWQDGLLAYPYALDQGPLLRPLVLRLDHREHAVLLGLHHIVTDGWSEEILLRELSAAYRAARTGEQPSWAPLPLQYADYAAWQRGWLRDQPLATLVQGWQMMLDGAPMALPLITDRPRPRVMTHRGAQAGFGLSGETSAALREFCRRRHATLFIALLAAFEALLSRFGGALDFLVGAPVAGRSQLATEGLIGCFVNTLVLRADLAEDPSFETLVRRCREATLQASAHQDLPFEKLVEALQPARDLSRSPLVQALINFEQTEPLELDLGEVEVRPLDGARVDAQFDLSFGVLDDGRAVGGSLVYNTDLFDSTTASRFAHHLQALLGAALIDPQRPLSALPVLAASELQQLLQEWNDTACGQTDDAEATLHGLFAVQAASNPERSALRFADTELSYRQLDAAANRLARRLRAEGVVAEARVGLLMARCLELPVATLAILKSGGAYVPLAAATPRERLETQLRDAGIEVVLTAGDEGRLLADLEVQRIDLRRDADAIDAYSDKPLEDRCAAARLAYVIYTSGSTGRPKGVMVPHFAVLNFLRWLHRRGIVEVADRVVLKTPMVFDVSILELFGPLLLGLTVEIAPADGHRDLVSLVGHLQSCRATVLQLVPSQLGLLLDEPEIGRCTSLRKLISGGEALPESLRERCAELLPGVELINLYGPTEAAVYVTALCCSTGGRGSGSTVPLGRPGGDMRVEVVGRDLRPLPIGAAGELVISGRCLARGYIARPAVTALQLVPNALGDRPGGRLYRTGDLVRVLSDGRLEFLGRIDQQLKINGMRIEPEEIEGRLLDHPAVAEAAVVARPAAAVGLQLVAFFVADQVAPAELADWLRQALPEYLVPTRIEAVEVLPRTASRKIDRRALVERPLAGGVADEVIYVQPSSPSEEMLAEIWSELLGKEEIGSRHDFFALGGHSLLAMRMVARIRSACGVEVAVREIFARSQLAQLASYLDQRLIEEAGETQVDDLLELLESMDDEEALRLLEAETGAGHDRGEQS